MSALTERLRLDANLVGSYGDHYYQRQLRQAADTIDALAEALREIVREWPDSSAAYTARAALRKAGVQ